MTFTEELATAKSRLADLNRRLQEKESAFDEWIRTRDASGVRLVPVVDLNRGERRMAEAVDGGDFRQKEIQMRGDMESLRVFIGDEREKIGRIYRLIPLGRRVSVNLQDVLTADGKPLISKRVSMAVVTERVGPFVGLRLATAVRENVGDVTDVYVQLEKISFIE